MKKSADMVQKTCRYGKKSAGMVKNPPVRVKNGKTIVKMSKYKI